MSLHMAEILSTDSENQAGWTTCIHCSYYAVFQYMKYILAEKASSPISYENQDAHTGESSHKYILNEIRNRIRNSSDARSLVERVKNLRQQRVKADYSSMAFTQEESVGAKDEAKEIIKTIRRLFRA